MEKLIRNRLTPCAKRVYPIVSSLLKPHWGRENTYIDGRLGVPGVVLVVGSREDSVSKLGTTLVDTEPLQLGRLGGRNRTSGESKGLEMHFEVERYTQQ
jgi:hypothetical protein